MSSPRLIACASFALLSACVTAGRPQVTPAEPETRALPEPTWLPMEARQLLSSRMKAHGAELRVLLPSVVMLDYAWAERLASSIASEPRLAHPGMGDADTLNARLPERFFELQELVRTRAKALAAAAQAKDDARLGDAFGELTQACVSCHSLYVRGE